MEKTLYLIDGHALVFKMYYALNGHPMINSKGVDTSILYGFTKYVLELIEKEHPTHLGVSFDPPGGTFRHEAYPDYKGTRAATPQAIIDALDPLCEICRALDIPVLMIPGFEADDVIGSMAKKAEAEGFKVFMVTPDKDYGQLVTDNVVQLKPGKAGSDSELFDREKVCEKYGVDSPEKVIDFLTICGDASDNVPGVKGVGEVGAKKLLGEYGSVDGIYANLESLKPKQRELFEAARDHIQMSRFLVTIKTDIDLADYPTGAMAVSSQYGTDAFRLFDEYEFKSLKRYLGDAPAGYGAEHKDFSFGKISPAGLCSCASGSGICSIVSGTGVYFLAAENGTGIVTATGSASDFASVLSDSSIAKVGYSLKEIWKQLNSEGFGMEGKLLDIELMDYIINPEKSHQADVLAMTVLGVSMEEKKEVATEMSLFDSPAETTDKSREAAVYLALGKEVYRTVKEKLLDGLYDKMEEPLLRVLARMETEGVRVDMVQLRRYADSLSAELVAIQDKVRREAGDPQLNILSPKQIGVLLFEKLKLDPKIKAKNGVRYEYPTDEDTLVKLLDKNEVVGDILEYRAVRKLLNTYIDPFQG
ncbi:MAG: DNA polymerase, partial [Candidatus Cryptobacteroides sp.]